MSGIYFDLQEIEKNNNLILSIQVSLDGFSFSIADYKNKKLLVLNDVPHKISSEKFLSRRFNEWYQSEELLHSEFRDVKVIFDTAKFTLVPKQFSDEELNKTFADYLFETKENDDFERNEISLFNVDLFFLIPNPLKEEIVKHFENVKIIHPVKTITEDLSELNGKNRLILQLGINSFYAILFQKDKLLVANSFSFFQNQEILYYVLSLFKQLKISPGKTELFLLGNTTNKENALDKLKEYFLSVRLYSSQKFEVNSDWDNQNNSKYFTLLSSLQCV